MTRNEIREEIFKLIYESLFHDKESFDELLAERLTELKDADRDEIIAKFRAVADKADIIDDEIDHASNKWKIARMNKVDHAILRLGVYEMKYDDNVPCAVAINEAVNLAKKFGGDNSFSFVNGILGKISKQDIN